MRSLSALHVLGRSILFAAAVTTSLSASPESLGRYVPSNVYFYARGVHNADAARLSAPYEAAWQKLLASGIGNDILGLLLESAPRSQRAEIERVVMKVLGHLGEPSWAELVGREVVVAVRLSMPVPQLCMLFRVQEGSADARRAEFKKAFEGLAEIAPDVLSVAEVKTRDAPVVRLQAEGVPIPVSLSCATRGDVVMLSTSEFLLDDVVELMENPESAVSMARDERVTTAMKSLPGGGYSEFFMDMAGYFRFVGGMVEMGSGFAEGSEEGKAAFKLVRTLFQELTRLESVSGIERAAGSSYFLESRLGFSAKESPGYIERLIAGQKPLRSPLRGIPKDATSFYMTAGLDLPKVYADVLKLLETKVPGGAQALEEWARVQSEIGFNFKDDLFSWLDGAFGWVTLPGGSGCDVVGFLRVRDSEKVRHLVRKLVDGARSYTQSRGQAMDLVAIDGVENFYELRIDALPWLRPVIGMPEGSVILATSRGAAERVVATYSGSSPSILDNPRFRAVELPEGPLMDAYYADVEGSLRGFSHLVSGLGFVGALLPHDRDTEPFIKLGGILTKLGVFLADVDLAVDSAGWSIYDETKHEIRSRQMTTLRLPERKL